MLEGRGLLATAVVYEQHIFLFFSMDMNMNVVRWELLEEINANHMLLYKE